MLTLAQCGGASIAGERSKAADEQSSSDSSDHPRKSEHGQSEEPESKASSSPPDNISGTNCDDGTCSKCGGGICPAGWYCDEKASGGGACSWLAECAERPTCSCVARVLGPSCKCREEDGGLKVACE